MSPLRALWVLFWERVDDLNISLMVGLSSILLGVVLTLVRYQSEITSLTTGNPRFTLIVDVFAAFFGVAWWWYPILLIFCGAFLIPRQADFIRQFILCLPFLGYPMFGVWGFINGAVISAGLISSTFSLIIGVWMIVILRLWYRHQDRDRRLQKAERTASTSELWMRATANVLSESEYERVAQEARRLVEIREDEHARSGNHSRGSFAMARHPHSQ